MGQLQSGNIPVSGEQRVFEGRKATAFLYNGITVLPYRDHADKAQTLQFIDGDGNKRFCAWLPVKGNFVRFGSKMPEVQIICEGYATGKSLLDALPEAQIIVAGSAHNTYEVSKHFPDRDHGG